MAVKKDKKFAEKVEGTNEQKKESPIVKRKKLPTKTYTISKNGVKVGDKTLNIGDKIDLTKEGYKFFKQNKNVK